MNRIALIFCLCFAALGGSAQRSLVVCDVESSQPISQVSVRSSAGVEVTDSMGCFSVPDSCRSLIFTHVNYESRILNLDEVRDTVFLISKTMSMSEVVVFGKGKDDEVGRRMNRMLHIDKTEAQLLASDPAKGGNLLGLISKLLPKKWSKAAKRRQKAKEIIENY